MSQVGLLKPLNSTLILPITTLIDRLFRSKNSSSAEATAKDGLSPQGEFVKGINFNGDAITVEGHQWLSYSEALADGLLTPEVMPTETGIKKLHPTVNRKMRRMFNTVICKPQKLEIIQTLPNGIYDVYLWIMENYAPNHHSMDVTIGSEVVARGIAQLEVGHWLKYGPYRTTISEGTLNIAICTTNPERDAHIMGMTIFKITSPEQ